MKMARVTSITERQKHDNHRIDFLNGYLFDNMIDGILITDDRGSVIYINDAYEKIFSVSNIAILNRSIFEVKNDEVIINGFKTQKKIIGRLNCSTGRITINIAISPIYKDKKFKGVIGIYRENKLKSNEVEKVESSFEKNLKAERCINLNCCFENIITDSHIMKSTLLIAQKASMVSSTVLIRGESGTGKGMVAKAIHDSSNRKEAPFIKVNCGAIPPTLLESELFGHEQGSFTGAIKKKIGKFEQANGGTILLDEIGDMPMEMQVKLLRIIQEKEFQRVGGNETIRCDVRILAATNKNLEEQVEKGRFREDLYYRLNVIPVQLPSLRDRKEDIPILCRYFIQKLNKKIGGKIKGLADEVQEAFYHYDWPGNVRELENLMERLIVLSEEEIIQLHEIPTYISQVYNTTIVNSMSVGLSTLRNIPTLEEYEKEIIKVALQRFKSFNAAGKALGVTHKTIAAKARKYNIVEKREG
ncbi:sigma 54-interacting transcriptional regulator [Alkaliphilus sp. MSJ-5]|uniref:HTH-type transcriptional regulatory protein TyrR n=1 Tax=Alkaliphilus flagellatus TaxID=2841507 RepID=A0ABS6FZ17_9FIRM|nr:sigma 54-interacting transcriptional regulator [Alkaliphilus flagellatus]MBU5675492.1 sigma 54-interacting transcriptional regulator [Alkaliphilus flagellatus]